MQVVPVNSLGEGTASDLTSGTPVAAYMPATPNDLTAAGTADKATLTFMPTAGAVWFEAAIHAATGDWRVVTDALAQFAPCPLSAPTDGCTAVRQVTVEGTDKLQFDVPLSAFSYRDGQYAFKVRAVDANGVPGDWSDVSAAVTIGELGRWVRRGGGGSTVLAGVRSLPAGNNCTAQLTCSQRCSLTHTAPPHPHAQACLTRLQRWESAPGPTTAAWTCSSAPPGWRSRAIGSRCLRRMALRCLTRCCWAATRRAAAQPRRRRRSNPPFV